MKKYKNIVFIIVFISISFIIIIFNQIIDPYETKNFDNIIIENLDDNKKLAYTQFKKKMVQITPFYDFSFINDFTVKPIRYFFRMPSIQIMIFLREILRIFCYLII